MQPSQHSYLALGDSYTIGADVPQGQRWPNQLVERLRGDGLMISDFRIIAQNGWTTRDLINALDKADLSSSYSLVSLLIGVNNQYQGMGLEGYQHEFRVLLESAVALADGDPERVLVLSIPDWSVTPFAHDRDRAQIRAEIQAFNAVNHRSTRRVGARYVDITKVSQLAKSDPTLVADDGLHPSGKLYAVWMNLIYPIVGNILRKVVLD